MRRNLEAFPQRPVYSFGYVEVGDDLPTPKMLRRDLRYFSCTAALLVGSLSRARSFCL